MEGSGVVPVMDVNRNYGDGYGFGGNMGLWLFGILALGMLGSGNGLFGNNHGYQPQYATQQDVQMTSQFAQLLDGNRDIINNVTSGTAQAVAATNQAKYDNINVAKDIQVALMAQLSEIKATQAQALANQNQCCCETKMLIMDKSAATDALIIAENQKTRDLIQQNKIEALEAKVADLQSALREVGTVKYPMSLAYNAGSSPFCNNGCGCGF
mgnify:CR=1 FL=1